MNFTSRSLALFCLIAVCAWVLPAQADSATPPTRRVRLTCTAQAVDIPRGARELTLWLPFPPSDDWQEVSNFVVRSDAPTSVNRDDEYGNQILSLTVQNPQKPVRIELQVDVLRRERRNAAIAVERPKSPSTVVEKIANRWLQRDRLVPIDGRISDLARDVTRGKMNESDQVRAIYDYTVSTLKYDKSGKGWGRGDIEYACDARRGNCTDFHALFIGLCRARGIPARFEIGISLPTDEPAGEINGYHCWADCFVATHNWIPVDCSEAQKHPERRDYFFGAHDENRVTFSTGRDILLNPPQKGERLNFFVYPYAEVDGEPHDKIERTIRYEDL